MVYTIIALVAGLAIGYLLAHAKGEKSRALLEAERTAHEADQHEAEQRLSDALAQQQKSYEAQLSAQQSLLDREREGREADKKEARRQLDEAMAQLRKSFGENIALLKEQSANATEQLLKQRSQELQTANTTQIDALLKPLRQNIETMQKSMTDSREAITGNTARFDEAMKQMMERTNTIGKQADRLSNALQRKNKTMGNWGELILTELLESQGLKRGIHFDIQQTLRDSDGNALLNSETGSRMIPDVIVHLADNREVVVDAKTSLTAFVDYQNADSEIERHDAAARHLESVRSHIKELATKNYQEYIRPPHTSAGFVIMFVPNEGALQLAMAEDPTLWRDAFKNNVFIAGGQTLIAALHIVQLTWANVQQNRNTQRIIDEARKLIDRVERFHELFQKAGKKLTEATDLYHDMADKMYDGRMSIVGAGRNIEDLGVKGRKQLPDIGGGNSPEKEQE